MKKPEIVAPAGDLNALIAAVKYGADSVYIGLKEFSARARAENFTVDEMKDAVAFLRKKGKKAYLAVNILIKNDEIPRIVEALYEAQEAGIDAVIIQDMGLFDILKKHFQKIPVHASTQMACYNLDGALQLQDLGFKRIVLSRELSLDEIAAIRKGTDIELEVFIHGALCYSFSGLCLFSSSIGGRSGNRGQCAQPCRKHYRILPDQPSKHLFSTNDICLSGYARGLSEIGIDAFKIEGRMKGAYYSGFVSAFYRKLVDGDCDFVKSSENDLKLFYSRNFVQDYLGKRRAEITELDYPANVGLLIGQGGECGKGFVRFKTSRDFEVRDGLQLFDGKRLVDEFSIQNIKVGNKKVFMAKKGNVVSVDCGKKLGKGVKVFLSSSQSLKKAYSLTKLDKIIGHYKMPLDFDIDVKGDGIDVNVSSNDVSGKYRFDAGIAKSRGTGMDAGILRNYFSRLGNTEFEMRRLGARVPEGLFIAPQALNDVRRDTVNRFRVLLSENKRGKIQGIISAVQKDFFSSNSTGFSLSDLSWSVKVDIVDYLDALPKNVFNKIYFDLSLFNGKESDWEKLNGVRDKLIISMPLLRVKDIDYSKLADEFIKRGFNRWQAGNIGDIYFLSKKGVKFSADYHLYCLNSVSIRKIIEMGAETVTFSPEDEEDNVTRNIKSAGGRGELIVYQDSPFFVSRICVYKYYKGCAGSAACRFHEMEIENDEGDRFIVVRTGCDNIVIGRKPYSISRRIKQLAQIGQRNFRIDFCCRVYTGEEIKQILEKSLNFNNVTDHHEWNYNRKLY